MGCDWAAPKGNCLGAQMVCCLAVEKVYWKVVPTACGLVDLMVFDSVVQKVCN